ncbi:hypothetical protein UlMin_013063 [Ulmus minor]
MASVPSILFLVIVRLFIIISHTFCNTSKPTNPPNITTLLIFGDSTLDPGNNNYLSNPLVKGNHYPYGKDFPGHIPNGRFSNGKLVTDFLASKLRIKDFVPPFLDPNLSDNELVTGVSFASGGSGLDELTTVASGAISVSKQIELLKKYIVRIERIVGEIVAKKIVNKALVIVCAGTNDFGFNFYDIPIRRLEFDIDAYQDFLLGRLQHFIEELYRNGCRNMVIAGLPPIGCLPIQITAKSQIPNNRSCVEDENSDAKTYNYKLHNLLFKLQANLPGTKLIHADIYNPLLDMINSPQKYGFVETNRGCCGTGLLETGPLCNVLSTTCDDASRYLFWDSVHPSEATYRYLAEILEQQVYSKFYSNRSEPTFTLIR